jgi:hypothetical protein
MSETPRSEYDRRANYTREESAKDGAKLERQAKTPEEPVARDIQDTFSHQLARMRAERGITPEQLRERLRDRVGTSMTRGTLYRIENPSDHSATRPVRLDEAIEIAAALDVALVDLLEPERPNFIDVSNPRQVFAAGIKVGGSVYSDIGDQIVGETAWADRRRLVEEPDTFIPRPGYEAPPWPGQEPGNSARMEEVGLGELWRLFAKVRRVARWVGGRNAPPIEMTKKGELTVASALARDSAQEDVALVDAIVAQTKARLDEWASETRRRLIATEDK